ncbi:MAG: hypothetical protein Q7W55_09685 [Pseudohongiella sp.]|nr:hypothetical protein [Pseudohongiella sp.]
MKVIFKKMLDAELRSAAGKNYTLDLLVTFVGASLFTVLSFTANNFGWGGFLAAVLFFWHRFVVLNVVNSRAGTFRWVDNDPSSSNDDK